ncbi:MAG: adenosylcobyric acid synthase [Campylobacterota bacterium]|nr:adenosylcobyric acid synthase [Campylobacterota bacterium]
MKSISIFGTSSDAGKSTLTFVIGRLLQEHGINIGVFKAQNVSNNSHVTDDGSEIAIAQYFQAEVLGIPTSYHLNPVLLKSGHGNSASLIVKGKVVEDKDVREYYRDLDTLKPAVDECFEYLSYRYECIVCEGAGSPVELNLMDKDLSNIYIAQKYNTKIILVADIEKGGVFASIWGVYNLLPEALRANVIGVIVNKFRGDRTLFDEGVNIIEERFGIPVLGVLPYLPLNLGFEDSQSLKNFVQNKPNPTKKIGIINYPTMSNYNDFEPLIADETIFVEFITSNVSLESFDLIILPGSKLVIKDLQWLKKTGLFEALKERQKEILGICGGYQMMFDAIIDEECVETAEPSREEALGFIDDIIVFQKDKVLKKGEYSLFGKIIQGFEIHHGVSAKYPLVYEKGPIKGTFVHGLFEDEAFETYKKTTIDSFVATMREEIDMERILNHVL